MPVPDRYTKQSASAKSRKPGNPMSQVNNLCSLLRSLKDRTEGETVTIADLLNAVGRRSYGPVLLLDILSNTAVVYRYAGWVFGIEQDKPLETVEQVWRQMEATNVEEFKAAV